MQEARAQSVQIRAGAWRALEGTSPRNKKEKRKKKEIVEYPDIPCV